MFGLGGIMNSAFISYCTRDSNFVSLMEAVLRFSGVNAWRCETSLQPGTKYREEIAHAIADADLLLVVVSKNAAQADWVSHEVSLYLSKNPKKSVIPIRLDETTANSIYVGLETYQAVDFSRCMLAGFNKLMEVFGKEFHYREKRRPRDNRRLPDRRDPRNTPRRVRRGFWLAFEKATGYGKFDEVTLGEKFKAKLLDALDMEVHNYFIAADGERKEVDVVLREAVDSYFREKAGSAAPAVVIVESIADLITSKYAVSPIGRRAGQDRRSREVGKS
jgi:hypothetical protein